MNRFAQIVHEVDTTRPSELDKPIFQLVRSVNDVDMIMSNIVLHLESHLGRIEKGWSKDETGKPMRFQVAKFVNGTLPGCSKYCTVGLSHFELASSVSGKIIRQEILFLSKAELGDRNIPGILQQVGDEALNRARAYLRGDVIGPRGPLIDGSQMEALYVAMPVYFPESFYSCQSDEAVSIVIAWLVPISSREAGYIRNQGWDAFENKLLEYDPDLVDLNRSGMPL